MKRELKNTNEDFFTIRFWNYLSSKKSHKQTGTMLHDTLLMPWTVYALFTYSDKMGPTQA